MKSNLVSTYRQQRPGNIVGRRFIFRSAQVNAVNFVYETPFKSRLFCLYYKVKKIIKIELSPGQSHKHKATYHINKRVDVQC